MTRPSSTLASVQEAWRPSRRHLLRRRNRPIAVERRRRWDALSWRTSLSIFLVPVGLLIATLVIQRVAANDGVVLRVTDLYTGAPLAGANVTAGTRALTTNDKGEVKLAPGELPLRLTVQHDRYDAFADEHFDPELGDSPAVSLRPSFVEGRINDAETGAPIAGAVVSAVADTGERGAAATTGPDGRYSLADVPANARLRVEAGDYGTTEWPVGEDTRADIGLRLSVVTGVIRDPAGVPVHGARVSAVNGTPSTVTNADGSFRLTDAAGVAELLVRAAGFADQRLAVPAGRQLTVTVEPEAIKAVYANLGVLSDPARLNRLLEIADETEINALVVDVKQDTIYYPTQVPFFREIDGMVTPVFDPAELLATLDAHGIYSIARMVVFKDPVVAEARPDLSAMDEQTGELWRDMNGAAWVNAFNDELWAANTDLAVELSGLGFDEVQYDYIRFPSDGDLRTADFGREYTEEARRAAITGAVKLGADKVRPTGAKFAIDLFPIIAIFGNDQGIGQTLQDLVPLADYINLMIYPSHYTEGNIPVEGHPNDFPAETVTYTLEAAEALVPGSKRKMRPWLQDFTYPAQGFTAYGPAEVRAQIDAAESHGVSGWMLWNAAGEFQVEALRPQT